MIDQKEIEIIRETNRSIMHWFQGLECHCDSDGRCDKKNMLIKLEQSAAALSRIEAEAKGKCDDLWKCKDCGHIGADFVNVPTGGDDYEVGRPKCGSCRTEEYDESVIRADERKRCADRYCKSVCGDDFEKHPDGCPCAQRLAILTLSETPASENKKASGND